MKLRTTAGHESPNAKGKVGGLIQKSYSDLGEERISTPTDFHWHENATFAVSRIFREVSNRVNKLHVSKIKR